MHPKIPYFLNFSLFAHHDTFKMKNENYEEKRNKNIHIII